MDDDELVGLLAGVVDLEAARAAWPEVQLSPQTFLEHLASSLRARGRADDPAAWAARLHLSDLYLACGCLAGDEAALRGFEPILQAVPGILRSLSTDPGFVGDVRATVAEELFVHRPGKSPKIARYSGEGSLRSWFTVIVQRTALGLKRGAGNVPLASTDDFSDLLIGGFDPELELLREKFLPQLQSAMREAAGRLTRRDRIILRLSMVKGLTMQQIADWYQVNQSTVSRWIARALEDLHHEIRRILRQSCQLPVSEVESLIRAVRSRVEVSLPGLFGATATDVPHGISPNDLRSGGQR